jgi:hypothetical protein
MSGMKGVSTKAFFLFVIVSFRIHAVSQIHSSRRRRTQSEAFAAIKSNRVGLFLCTYKGQKHG